MTVGHDGWRYQGRQYHQWFGHGTKPKDEKEQSLTERVEGLASTLVASLPPRLRRHGAAQMGAADRARFVGLVSAMARSHGVSPAVFAGHFFGTDADRAYVQPLQEAARQIATATTAAERRGASDSLAKGVLAVGIDRWLPFMREAAERIEGRADPQVILVRDTGRPVVKPTAAPPTPEAPLTSLLPPPARLAITAAGFLLGLISQRAAEDEVAAAADRFGLDLTQEADAKAAVAYVTIRHEGPRVLALLTDGKVDREMAAQAVMEAERRRPGLLERMLDGQPPALAAERQVVAATGQAFGDLTPDEEQLVDELRMAGKSDRDILAALDDHRARRRFEQARSPEDGNVRRYAFIPPEVLKRIPLAWGPGRPGKKDKQGKPGWRWTDPKNPKGDNVRIDRGNPDSKFPSQRPDHVVVQWEGKVIGRDGRPIEGSIPENYEAAHIPLDEYRTWKYWNMK